MCILERLTLSLEKHSWQLNLVPFFCIIIFLHLSMSSRARILCGDALYIKRGYNFEHLSL
jgi:hypothetical protein